MLCRNPATQLIASSWGNGAWRGPAKELGFYSALRQCWMTLLHWWIEAGKMPAKVCVAPWSSRRGFSSQVYVAFLIYSDPHELGRAKNMLRSKIKL